VLAKNPWKTLISMNSFSEGLNNIQIIQQQQVIPSAHEISTPSPVHFCSTWWGWAFYFLQDNMFVMTVNVFRWRCNFSNTTKSLESPHDVLLGCEWPLYQSPQNTSTDDGARGERSPPLIMPFLGAGSTIASPSQTMLIIVILCISRMRPLLCYVPCTN
jgi:hypothetical protein